jgi:hypothetical protein
MIPRIPKFTPADVAAIAYMTGNQMMLSYEEFNAIVEDYTQADFKVLEILMAGLSSEVHRSIVIRDYENIRCAATGAGAIPLYLMNFDVLSRMIVLGVSWADATMYCEEVYEFEYCPRQIVFHTVDPDEDERDNASVVSASTASSTRTPEPADVRDLPKFRFRKDVCDNFPVVIAKIQSSDRTDRYSVVWHNANLRKAAKEAQTDRLSFEKYTHGRLVKALERCRYWTVEPARSVDEICVIAMNYDETKPRASAHASMHASMQDDVTDIQRAKPIIEKAPVTESNNTINEKAAEISTVATTVATTVAATVAESDDEWEVVGRKALAKSALANLPKSGGAAKSPSKMSIRSLKDIKDNFPVVWNESGDKVFAISLFNKKITELRLDPATVKTNLMTALRSNTRWTILSATNPKEVCRIRISA